LIEWYVAEAYERERERERERDVYKAQSYKELDTTETERALNTGQTIESATFVKDIVTLPS
jgi:hypothetical protein